MIDPVTRTIMETSGDYQYMRDEWTPPTELPSLQDANIIALDLETLDPDLKKYGPGWATDNGYIVGISIATDTGIAEYFPINHADGNLNEKEVIAWLKRELETDIPKVFANNYYDCGWLSSYGIEPKGPWYDIQIAAPLLDEHKLSYSLDNLGAEYCDEHKDESGLEAVAALLGIAPKDIKSKMDKLHSKDVAKYAIQDAVLTLKVWNVLKPKLEEEGLWPIFMLETELSPVLIKMRKKGVRINAQKRDELIKELNKREAVANEELEKLCGRPIDVWSAGDISAAYIQHGIEFYYTKASVAKALKFIFDIEDKVVVDQNGKEVEWVKVMNDSPIPQHELASYSYINSLELKKLFENELEFQFKNKTAKVFNSKIFKDKNPVDVSSKELCDEVLLRWFYRTLNPSVTSKFLDQQNDEISKNIKASRKWNRAVSAFLNNSFTDMVQNGRIYCCYHQLKKDEGGTITGRFSCSNPNLQQVPVRDPEIGTLIRSLFEAEPGKIWGSFDYKAQEPRLLVHYCKQAEDLHLIDTQSANQLAAEYNQDPMTDSHQWTADIITNMYGNILGSTNKIRRQAAKTINLGKAYVMGVKKLAMNLGITEEEAKPIVEAYDKGLPHIKAFQKFAAKQAEIKGFVKTILGRKLHFPLWEPKLPFGDTRLVKPETLDHAKLLQNDPTNEIWHNRLLRRAKTYKAINSVIQGSAADMTKRAMILLARKGYIPALQVHDELNFTDLTSMEQVEEIKKIMEEAIPLCIPVVCEAGTGENWGEAH